MCNRPYYVARKEDETHINDYNPAILLTWKANIDIQYIPADATDVVNYITAYTTKGEKVAKDNMEKYAMEGMSRSKLLFKERLGCSKLWIIFSVMIIIHLTWRMYLSQPIHGTIDHEFFDRKAK